MSNIGIYKITSPTGKIYIGQSINIKMRFKGYKYLRPFFQDKLFNSFKKYGYENHNFEIIHNCKEDELNYWELYYGKLYNVTGENGLNIRDCGGSNGRHSIKTKQKMSEKAKIRFSKPENNPFYKKHHTIETKNILSVINVNKPRNEDAIRKAVLKNTGKKRTDFFKKSRMGENNKMYNKKHTEETKKIQSEKIKLAWEKRKKEGRDKQSKEHINKRISSTNITKKLILEERRMMVF